MTQPYKTLIDVDALAARLGHPDWALFDCRFDLADTGAGELAYLEAHVPGAVYVHLDRDLSAAKQPSGRGGRHPMPSPEQMTALFGRLGIDSTVQVVAYDATNGHYAARLWWMLRYMGHEAVALLDGGWQAWLAAQQAVAAGREERPKRVFEGAPRTERLVLMEDLPGLPLLVDGRAPERYRGEVEPLDPVAGHIPGSVNRPYTSNWNDKGGWKSPEALLAGFADLLGDTRPEDAGFYCGSGVTACVNLVAMVHAGLPEGRLYAGSWSEWSSLNG